MAEEAAVKELEIKALQSEAEWFVSYEIPSVIRKINKILVHCLAFLSPKGIKELETNPIPQIDDDDVIIPALDAQNRHVFETPDGTLRGYINVGGWSVTEADISIKFSKWNKSSVQKASISATHPWRLAQLQNAYNFVRMTLDELGPLIEECDKVRQTVPSTAPISSALSSSIQSPPSSSHGSSLSFSTVNKLVNQVSRWMTQTRDALTIPPKSVFPASLSKTGFKGFHPPLPPDLHIEFSICNAEIVASVYALHIGTGPLPPPESSPRDKLLSASTGGGGAGAVSGSSPHPTVTSSKVTGASPASSSSASSSSLDTPNSPRNTTSDKLPSSSSSAHNLMKQKAPSVSNLISHTLYKARSPSKVEPVGGKDAPGTGAGISAGVGGSMGQGSGAQQYKEADKEPEAWDMSQTALDYRISIGGTLYKTYQVVLQGVPSWVAVLDQTEVHCVVPRINHAIELLTEAQELLADVADKLVALLL